VPTVREAIGPALSPRYVIERELGEGTTAIVFLARDTKHDRLVAIKVLKEELATAISQDRFHREIEVVANLAHPHIMPLHDSGAAGTMLYFVMPHVEGETLKERLEREGRLSLVEAARITGEIADALQFAHSHGIIHRDVKPANIMLTGRHAMLSDFGIARLAGGADATLTGSGLSIGTPVYMSPEQVAGDETVDGRSDIYSLGCVLFEMVAGRPPFDDASRRAVLTHHIADKPPDLRSVRPDTPSELAGIIKTALEKEPDKRFATAEEHILHPARTERVRQFSHRSNRQVLPFHRAHPRQVQEEFTRRQIERRRHIACRFQLAVERLQIDPVEHAVDRRQIGPRHFAQPVVQPVA